jgi:hypothetical protein
MAQARFDETEIDPARREPVVPSSDTVRETAIDSGSIPIFVAERLDSRYLPPIEPEAMIDDVRDDDSGKSTLPRGTAQIPKTAFVRAPAPRRSYAGVIATVLIVLILLTAAFLAGRYLKF